MNKNKKIGFAYLDHYFLYTTLKKAFVIQKEIINFVKYYRYKLWDMSHYLNSKR